MARDFTKKCYKSLLRALAAAYSMVPFRSFDSSVTGRVACLRHDVDRSASAALPLAAMCHEHSIPATFYFRYPYTFDAAVMDSVWRLGHEVGYHYETVSKANGDMRLARDMFERELGAMRSIVPIDTVCMHGSPLSRWDNRDLWSVTAIEEYGLVGEPYLSLTADVGYLTDTGRGWNRRSASLRDAMPGPMPSFESTFDLIRAIEAGTLPDRLMINIHPERWNDGILPWAVELIGQTAKNQVKSVLRRVRRARA